MHIILYNSNAEKNRLNKNRYLKKIIEMDGTLRNTCSVLNPVVNIELNPETVKMNILKKIFIVDDQDQYTTTDGSIKLIYDLISNIITANYIYIQDFNRYYFITDITSIRNNLWQISMRVDVLMSYYVEIKNLNAFISRNEFKFDPLIKDDIVSYYYDKDIIEYVPEKGDKVNYTFDSCNDFLKNNYAVTVINDLSGMSFDVVNSPSEVLPKVGGWVTGASAMSITYGTFNASITQLAGRLLNDDNLATYVISLMCYPFTLPTGTSEEFLRLGHTELSPTSEGSMDAVYVYSMNKKCSDYMVIADFTITGDSFFDFNPYTTYDIFIPYLGWINLDPDQILNKRILVVYTVDYKSGSAQVSLVDDTSNKIIYTTQTQLGVRVPINTTNATEVENSRLTNNIGLGLGLASSTISVVGGIATYNPLIVAGGLVGATKSVTTFIQNNNTNYSKASGSVGSGNSGVYLSQDVRIRKTSVKPRGYDSDFASLYGKPLNQYMKIGDLSGMTVIGECHLENIPSATDGELTEIDQILKSGILI